MKISDLLHPKRLLKRSITAENELSTIEAYDLWNTLQSRYASIETYKLYKNFIHDRDFDLLLSQHLKNFQKQVKILENIAKKIKIKVPSKPPEQIKISTKIDEISDKMIFKKISTDLISELYLMSQATSRSRVNDNLRNNFINFVTSHLTDLNDLYKYGNAKGWTETEPPFRTDQPTKKLLSTIEAGHLWELLNFRYDQLQLTRIFLALTNDKDLKLILDSGTSTLKDQIKIIEELAAKFEIPLPEKPPASQQAKVDPATIEDKVIFRIIIKGIQDAISKHIRAVVESKKNNNIRKLFLQLYQQEIEFYNDFIRYGKTKGWAYISPKYRKL
ncbi:DUF3231 family protein [Natroniella acetigena]|uniref:DUF3231 family protein n=1 Tax=Natroniella acetigena TaxID=52004 RepID=UPI00200A9B8F|nr:DUF3231 family protein [Natroniella acetigena]MCK8827211.1 DUF3231 family protein [Natroniella acetigena]